MKNLDNDFAGLPATDLPATERLSSQVREELLALPYSAFLQVIARLLERQGYREIRLLGRKGFVGRNRGGGWDLEAKAPWNQATIAGQEGSRCVIQVKHFDELVVQQRSVDELRGCILRAGVGMGLIITTSRFSPVAQEAAEASSLAPVLLLGGDRLLSLLIHQKLGVRQKPGGKWDVDLAFFRSVREEASLNAQEAEAKQEGEAKMGKKGNSKWSPLHKNSNGQVLFQENSSGHVLHLSIVLAADSGYGNEPGTKEKKHY